MPKKKIVIGKEDVLIIVDGQNDFLRHDGALYVAGVTAELSTNFVWCQRNFSEGH